MWLTDAKVVRKFSNFARYERQKDHMGSPKEKRGVLDS